MYAKSGASACSETFNQKDLLLQDVFEIIFQFGDIPVILAGDFQVEPSNYPSVATAIHFHRWQDPLVQVDEDGNLFRPLTFSRDGTFTGHGDYCTSIDAILVNHVAFAALKSIQVLAVLDVQHRPIRATFNWEPITQCGDVHVKFAPLDTSSLPHPNHPDAHGVNERAQTRWSELFASCFLESQDASYMWQLVNQFCVETLTDEGASWGFLGLWQKSKGSASCLHAKKGLPWSTSVGYCQDPQRVQNLQHFAAAC